MEIIVFFVMHGLLVSYCEDSYYLQKKVNLMDILEWKQFEFMTTLVLFWITFGIHAAILNRVLVLLLIIHKIKSNQLIEIKGPFFVLLWHVLMLDIQYFWFMFYQFSLIFAEYVWNLERDAFPMENHFIRCMLARLILLSLVIQMTCALNI